MIAGLRIAAQGTMLVIPTAYQFVAERLLESQLRTSTADNDINAIRFWRLPAKRIPCDAPSN
jgi:hypothetical protein